MRRGKLEAAPRARRFARLWLPLLLMPVILLAGCGSRYELQGTPYNPIIDAPEIVGTGIDGNEFRLSDLEGKVVLAFFGYTFCPDICPTTLGLMKQVEEQLGDRADELAVLFVSIDPERDSPEQIGVYTRAFSENFLGVHLDQATLDEVKKGYGVYAEKRVLDASQSSAGYLVDHTGWIYVIDKKGQLREVFATDATVEPLVEDVRHLMGRW
jgi:protein SCO1/2